MIIIILVLIILVCTTGFGIHKFKINTMPKTMPENFQIMIKSNIDGSKWYNGIDKMGNDLVTISPKGINILNPDTLDISNTLDNSSEINQVNVLLSPQLALPLMVTVASGSLAKTIFGTLARKETASQEPF